MSRVHEDRHGIYVKAGGYIIRPDISERFHNQEECLRGKTQYVVGDQVKANHIGGSGLGLVGDEYWFTHGSYYDYEGRQISSEDCWEGE
jgi:hypothetical protein